MVFLGCLSAEDEQEPRNVAKAKVSGFQPIALHVNHVPVSHLTELHFPDDAVLEGFDFIIMKFENLSTIRTHDMVVMIVIK